MTIGPSHASRSQAKSAIVIVGSKTRLMRSATVPPVSEKTANRSGSVVSLSNHQPGCSAMSTSVRSESVGGIVNPLWTSRSRAPATGVSTVRMSALNPAARARRTRSRAGLAVVPQVELEPAVRVRCRGGHVFGRRRPERRQRVRDAHAARDAGDRRLALLVHQPGEPGRGEDQRQRRRPAEDRRRGVDLRDVLEDAAGRTRSARTPPATGAGSSPSPPLRRRSRTRREGRGAGPRTGGPRSSRPRRGGVRRARAGPDPCGGTAAARTSGGFGGASRCRWTLAAGRRPGS